MGFYYSLYEWYNPVYKEDVNKYVDPAYAAAAEEPGKPLPARRVWPDGEWDQTTPFGAAGSLAWLYNQSPVKNTVVVNDRWGGGRKNGGFTTTEYGQGNSSLTSGNTAALANR